MASTQLKLMAESNALKLEMQAMKDAAATKARADTLANAGTRVWDTTTKPDSPSNEPQQKAALERWTSCVAIAPVLASVGAWIDMIAADGVPPGTDIKAEAAEIAKQVLILSRMNAVQLQSTVASTRALRGHAKAMDDYIRAVRLTAGAYSNGKYEKEEEGRSWYRVNETIVDKVVAAANTSAAQHHEQPFNAGNAANGCGRSNGGGYQQPYYQQQQQQAPPPPYGGRGGFGGGFGGRGPRGSR